MLAAFKKLNGRFIGCSRNTTVPVFVFISTSIRPGDLIQCFAFDDDYSFSILESHLHRMWFKTKGSSRGTGPRYTPESVFHTFPWPQSPNANAIRSVAAAGHDVRRIRAESLPKFKGLRDLYRTLELPGANPLKDAHARLDTAVRAAYGMPEDADPLAFLLELNLACATKEIAGKQITPPGLPLRAEDRATFITNDCIQPPVLS
jgi:hypothetical protein